ncbi:MAG: TonB-dependent receptor, partial [Tardiphaga sp.]|nr:TonB-dependent receptor [Tardiphaga sp.]
MSNFIARSFFLSGASSLLMVGLADIAAAQTELPGITVTAPSPIVRRKPVAPPTPVRVSRGTARNAPATPQPQPQRQQAVAPQAPQQGVLPIVADQFATVTVVPNDEIRRSGAATLGDLLNSKPGITGSSFAPGASSRPIIRGL